MKRWGTIAAILIFIAIVGAVSYKYFIFQSSEEGCCCPEGVVRYTDDGYKCLNLHATVGEDWEITWGPCEQCP